MTDPDFPTVRLYLPVDVPEVLLPALSRALTAGDQDVILAAEIALNAGVERCVDEAELVRLWGDIPVTMPRIEVDAFAHAEYLGEWEANR